MPAVQHYSMLVELRYCDPNVDAPNTAPLLISPPLSITTTRHRTTAAPLLMHSKHSPLPPSHAPPRLRQSKHSPPSGDVLTSALEPEQKIRIPLPENFNPHHLMFAVTIVRKRDAKCKRTRAPKQCEMQTQSKTCSLKWPKSASGCRPKAQDCSKTKNAFGP